MEQEYKLNVVPNNAMKLIENKYTFFRNVIQKTILHVQQNKTLDITGMSEVGICMNNLCNINECLTKIKEMINLNDVSNTDIL
jgi:hypothetical protein